MFQGIYAKDSHSSCVLFCFERKRRQEKRKQKNNTVVIKLKRNEQKT